MAKCIRAAGGEYLESVRGVRRLQGREHPRGQEELSAFSLALRAEDQTLTDAHADEAVTGILSALEKEYGVKLR